RRTRRRRFAIRNNGEAHRKDSTVSFTVALNANRTSMQLDELPDNRQAEPKPAMRPGGTGFLLTKPVEHIRQEFSMDAKPGIGHDNVHLIVGLAPHKSHRYDSLLRELDGIRHEV